MFNDFVLVGPGDDPVGIADASRAADARAAISEAEMTIPAASGSMSAAHQRLLSGTWVPLSSPREANCLRR